MRRVQSEGGFATMVRRGDPDRGAITLLVAERGQITAVIERQMAADFTYRWREISAAGPSGAPDWREWLDRKAQFDPDSWVIELDVADAQRFIAETTASG